MKTVLSHEHVIRFYALFVLVLGVFISGACQGVSCALSCSQPPLTAVVGVFFADNACTYFVVFVYTYSSLPFTMSSEQPSSDATDIFSLSDRVLAEKLQFVKEVHSVSLGTEPPLTTMTHIIS